MATYKQKYEQLRESESVDINNKIKEHKESYIHIPFSWRAIGMFFAMLGSIGLAIANYFLILSTWKLLALGENKITGFHQLLILYLLIGEYILIGLAMICFAAMIKGGFDKLKSFDEEGLIMGLIVGLIVASSGLIVGLIVGLINFVISCGINWAVGVVLIGGLIVAFSDEFER